MKNEMQKLALIAVLALIFQPEILLADDTCRGIGGTGRALDCGIGGTGNSANAGIGGTGHVQSEGGIGGTGIVGIITGFGSIWVNGLEIQYDTKTQVADNNAAASTKDLAIGQVVVVEAKGSEHQLQADKISVVDAVAGQISALDDKEGKLTVLGQTVTITAQTIAQNSQAPRSERRFSKGDYVRVSGLRLASGEIVASRIEATEPAQESSLVGPITKINGRVIEVYGLKINASGTNTSGLREGQEIAVTGTLNDGVFVARVITLGPSTQLYGRTEYVNLQGYIAGMPAEGQIKVGNLEVVVTGASIVSGDKQNVLVPGELVQISGHFANDQRVIAERIEISRDQVERVQLDRMGKSEREGSERYDRVDRADRNDHLDRPDRPDQTGHSEVVKQSEHSR